MHPSDVILYETFAGRKTSEVNAIGCDFGCDDDDDGHDGRQPELLPFLPKQLLPQ